MNGESVVTAVHRTKREISSELITRLLEMSHSFYSKLLKSLYMSLWVSDVSLYALR